MRRVAVVGAGMTTFGEHFELGIKDLVPMAVTEAVGSVDKGFDRADVDAAWFGELTTTDGFPSGIFADSCGLLDVPVTRVENACATGNDAIRNGVYGVASGMLDVVLVAGADKVRESSARGTFWEWMGLTRDLAWDYPIGVVAPANFALHVSRYLHESPATRERYGYGPAPATTGEGGGGGNGAELGYGRQMRGQNLLMARRLVEAGVPFVNVFDFRQQGQNWDAHFKNFNQHKTHLLPLADQSLSALLEDLDQRGLLDSTLVVAMGEFGRTPKINADGGRDHWPDCYTVLLAGGGVRGGATYGASDRLGAFPATDPVTPADLAATIFWRFGIDPATEIHDRTGRPWRLADGQPLRTLFG